MEIGFIFAMCRTHENFEDIFYNVTISSYSVLIVAIIMLLIMLECDSFDGFDFCFCAVNGGAVADIVESEEKLSFFDHITIFESLMDKVSGDSGDAGDDEDGGDSS